MRSKIVLLALVSATIAAATVSAAVLPVPAAHNGALPPRSSWVEVSVTDVAFPEGLQISSEGVWVLKTQAQWDAFWRLVPSDRADPAELPAIDFVNQFAIVASYGVKDSAYAMEITHVESNGAQMVVTIDRQTPNTQGCHYQDDVGFVGGVAIVEKPAMSNFATAPAGLQTTTHMAAPEPSHVHWCYC